MPRKKILININYWQYYKTVELEKLCTEAIDSNPNAVKDYLSGKEKALKALLGNVMKQTRGRGNAQKIEQLLLKMLKNNWQTQQKIVLFKQAMNYGLLNIF